jgi:2-polyprenyl-3-methyl-5-hydroxy-6-metoxy-1,4-benzoquinol methylase
MSNSDHDQALPYVLGHSDHERDRLTAQARLADPITRQFFRDAGIAPGMRVLDIGSGGGHVAFLSADLVGITGEVIGTDTASGAIAAASGAAQDRALPNVKFRRGDPAEMRFEQRFDAVVGRYVLWSLTDPSLMLRRLAEHLQPGGLMVFHEPDWTSVRSFPPAPLYDRACQWIVETARLAGTPWNMADRMYAAFVGAHLPAPKMRMQTLIGGAVQVGEWLRAVGDIIASLLPEMERLGVAMTDEVELATLTDRLRRDVATNDSVIIGRSEIGAWSRV